MAWVTAAFGPFWGFQEGWWSWLSGVTDNSVYPVLFLTYLDAVVPGDCALLSLALALFLTCVPKKVIDNIIAESQSASCVGC